MEKPERTQVLEKMLVETRRIRPRNKLLMVVLALVAGGFLLTLKHGSVTEHKAVVETQAKQAEQRETSNAEITQVLQKQFVGASQNKEQQTLVARVGASIISKTDASKAKSPLKFYLLAEPNHINIYGLSTGDIYITTATLNRMQTEGQLAAVLAHAAAHVLDGDGLSATTVPNHPKPIWQHTTAHEHAADMLTVKLMSQAGYDPNAFVSMLGVLAAAYHAGADVGFFTTHPNAADRIDAINAAIKQLYPTGVPAVLSN